MLLAVDIGNSRIKFGLFDRENLFSKFSLLTNRSFTAKVLNAELEKYLDVPILDAIACSVVPEVEDNLAEALRLLLNVEVKFVRNDFDFGLKIEHSPVESIGTDRIVNAFSAVQKYDAPCIVCSFGTALTIDVVDPARNMIGGLIAPGMQTLAAALKDSTSKLPEVKIEKPPFVLQNTTDGCIQSGIVYGYFGMVEELLKKVRMEADEKAKVVATGGFALFVSENTTQIDIVDENLLLDGLRVLNERKPIRR